MNKKNLKKATVMLAGALAIGASVAGCGSQASGTSAGTAESASVAEDTKAQSASSQTDGEKKIVLAESWSFASLYPVITPERESNLGSAYWSRNFYDTLVEYNEKGEIVPALAKEWTVSDDGLTVTFVLKEGIKFSDGTPLTADAVKKSIDASNENLGPYAGNYGKIGALTASTEVADDTTFVMHLSSPYYNAVNDLTYSCPYAIVNPKAFEGGADKAYETCASATMGTGPYMFESHENGVYTFTRNPNYWGDAPDVEVFQIKEIADNDSKVLALKSNEIDAIIGASRLTHEDFSQLKDAGYGTSVDTRATSTFYFGMRLADVNVWNENYTEVTQTVPAGVFADKKVRQAASMVIDQQLLAEKVFNGIDTPAETFFEKTKPYCNVEQKIYETDPEGAARLLEEAGWKDTDGDGVLDKNGEKLSVKISFSNDLGTVADAMEAVKGQLEGAGFEVTLAPAADMMAWYMAGMTGDYDLIYWTTNGGAMDPSSTVSNICSVADPVLGLLGGFGRITPELIAELDSTPDSSRVEEIYKELLTDISEEALIIPIVHQNEIAAWNPDKIEGYEHYYDAEHVQVKNIKLK